MEKALAKAQKRERQLIAQAHKAKAQERELQLIVEMIIKGRPDEVICEIVEISTDALDKFKNSEFLPMMPLAEEDDL